MHLYRCNCPDRPGLSALRVIKQIAVLSLRQHMLLLHAARRINAAQHTAIGVRQNLPPRLALLNPQGIVIHLRLQMLLLNACLGLQLLVKHPCLLLLLDHHLILHPLLAGVLIPRLVRVVQGVDGLRKHGKRQ